MTSMSRRAPQWKTFSAANFKSKILQRSVGDKAGGNKALTFSQVLFGSFSCKIWRGGVFFERKRLMFLGLFLSTELQRSGVQTLIDE